MLSTDAAEKDLLEIEEASDLRGAVPEALLALEKFKENSLLALKVMKPNTDVVVTFWGDTLDVEAALDADRATVGPPEQPL